MATKKQQEKIEISTNNYIAAIAVGTTLVVIICAIIGKSLVSSLILNTKLISKKIQANNALETKVENAPKLIEAYNDLGSNKQLIEDSLPNTEDLPQLASITENMAAISGVKLKSLSPALAASSGGTASISGGDNGLASGTGATSGTPGAAAGPASPKAVEFSVNVTGPYRQIVEFLRNIELSSRPMQVKSSTFRGIENTVTADITITTYYQDKADISDKKEVVK